MIENSITIVIPSFNQSAYLAEAIESALSQTIICEVICVDDGSTDNSLAIAKSYEPKIKVISQVNKGLASARNTGIMNATGDYILPLDSDDTLKPNCLERIAETIKETNADIVSPSFQCFGVGSGDVILLSNLKVDDFKSANRIGYCSAIKKTALLAIGGYNPKMVYGWEDWDIWMDLLKRGYKLATIPEVLWMYRTKANSMYVESLKHSDFLSKQMRLNHPEIYV